MPCISNAKRTTADRATALCSQGSVRSSRTRRACATCVALLLARRASIVACRVALPQSAFCCSQGPPHLALCKRSSTPTPSSSARASLAYTAVPSPPLRQTMRFSHSLHPRLPPPGSPSRLGRHASATGPWQTPVPCCAGRLNVRGIRGSEGVLLLPSQGRFSGAVCAPQKFTCRSFGNPLACAISVSVASHATLLLPHWVLSVWTALHCFRPCTTPYRRQRKRHHHCRFF